jgi:hypothetical protein
VYMTFYAVDRRSKPLLRDFARDKCRKRVYDPMPVLYGLLQLRADHAQKKDGGGGGGRGGGGYGGGKCTLSAPSTLLTHIPLPRSCTVLRSFSASIAKLMRERRERIPSREPATFLCR